MNTKIILAAALLWTVSVLGTSFAEELKIGVIDFPKMQKTSSAIKKARAGMEKLQKESKAQLDKIKSEWMAIKAELNKKGLAEEKKKELQEKLKAKRDELDLESQTVQVKMALKQRSIRNSFRMRTRAIIAGIAKKEGLKLVLRKGAVAFAEFELDITDRVQEALDRGGPTPSNKPDAASNKPSAKSDQPNQS
jgi:outer membrane protein